MRSGFVMAGVVLLVELALLAAAAAPARAATLSPIGDPALASAQVVLRDLGLYPETIDGIAGPRTALAVSAFQTRAKLPATGVVDVATRHALDASPATTVDLAVGAQGLAVAALQFRLAWHGFPSGDFTTVLTPRVRRALLKFQRWAHLAPDGIAGAQTRAALLAPLPTPRLALSWPLVAPVGDPFGPRGARFHTGIDLPAPSGTAVFSAAVGTVTHAGPLAGGWGITVIVRHGPGLRTIYAHLSSVSVRVGQAVSPQTRLGPVGQTGDATGPHLHFEEQIRGAAVDPLGSLPAN